MRAAGLLHGGADISTSRVDTVRVHANRARLPRVGDADDEYEQRRLWLGAVWCFVCREETESWRWPV